MADKMSPFQELAIAFGNTFSTESGQKVLAEFKRIADRPSYEPGISDPERAPYWHEGRRSVLLLCQFMIAQGSVMMEAIQANEPLDKLAEVSILEESEED